MNRSKQAMHQGEINGEFEFHFGVTLKPKAKITPALCSKWVDMKALAVMNGEKRRKEEQVKLFNEHFPLDLKHGGLNEKKLIGKKDVWDLWEEWEDIVRNYAFQKTEPLDGPPS